MLSDLEQAAVKASGDDPADFPVAAVVIARLTSTPLEKVAAMFRQAQDDLEQYQPPETEAAAGDSASA